MRAVTKPIRMAVIVGMCLLTRAQAEDPPRPRAVRAAIQVQRVVRPAAPAVDYGSGIVFAPREFARALRQAEALIESKQYVEGTKALQFILDLPEDGFVQPDPEQEIYRSLRTEAQRMVGALPEPALEVYRQQFGPLAASLLKEAIAEGGSGGEKLRDVSRRFFHTESGYEATYRLAHSHFDRGNFFAAALCYDRLRQQPPAARAREPMLSIRAAVAWHRAGRPDEADRILAALAKEHRDAAVSLAGGTIRLELARRDRWPQELYGDGQAPAIVRTDWPTHRGGPTRNGILRGDAAGEAVTWDVSPQEDPFKPEQDLANDALLRKHANGSNREQTPLPTRQPIVLGNTVLVRSFTDVTALDRTTGRFLWRTLPDYYVSRLLPEDGRESSIASWEAVLVNRLNANLWHDATFGRLSSDGERVYAIEAPDTFPDPPQDNHLPPQRTNLLLAYQLGEGEGRCVWQVGGESGVGALELPLAGRFFLGPPLALGGELYCLCEHGTQIELLVLDPQTGQERWSQPLAASDGGAADLSQRRFGAVVAAADGILVCPTTTGMVVALDLSTRSLLWAYGINKTEPLANQDRNIVINGRLIPPPDVGGGWVDNTPILIDGRVLLTPQSSNEIHCLNLLDGSLVWKKPREDGLYIAGVADKRAVVVGRAHVRAYAMADGDAVWKRNVLISRPSGFGLMDDNHLLLPSNEQLVIIDLQRGEVVSNKTIREGVPLGNLAAVGTQIISQSVDHVFAFPRPKQQP